MRPTNLIAYAALTIALFAAGMSVLRVDARTGTAPSLDQSRRTFIVNGIERAAPAVVSINVVVQERMSRFRTDFWEFFYGPRYREVESIGSGFIFDSEGYVLTNYHVIEGTQVESVRLPDGRELSARLAGYDGRTDIAVLKIDGSNLPVAALGSSDDLLIGEWVIAIGNPFGELISDPQPSVTVGVVSATNRRVNRRIAGGDRLYQNMIQTDAAINPGNSGGPLVNAQGEVLGVNTMIFSTSGGSEGLGFAIPISRAERVAQEIIEYGRRRDPWAGFKVEAVDQLPPQLLDRLGIRRDSGCVVLEILEDAPAYQAGLRPGDVILSINGQPVANPIDIDFAIWSMFAGDTCRIAYSRGGEKRNLEFTIEELRR